MLLEDFPCKLIQPTVIHGSEYSNRGGWNQRSEMQAKYYEYWQVRKCLLMILSWLLLQHQQDWLWQQDRPMIYVSIVKKSQHVQKHFLTIARSEIATQCTIVGHFLPSEIRFNALKHHGKKVLHIFKRLWFTAFHFPRKVGFVPAKGTIHLVCTQRGGRGVWPLSM